MDATTIINRPRRITDLVNLQKKGVDLAVDLSFDIVPVHFTHQTQEFSAYIFLCRYFGTADKRAFTFRKCYAKGCPHNLCPHVAQAVMIANRYLKRDYKTLSKAGISLKERMFTLTDMVLKFEDLESEKNEDTGCMMTIHDYINISNEGHNVFIQIDLEAIPAVEHFARHKNEQTFLMADFQVSALGRKNQFQRCLACYETENETDEKPMAVSIANERLRLLFHEFDSASIQYSPCFFN
jgi:hypothetical protein